MKLAVDELIPVAIACVEQLMTCDSSCHTVVGLQQVSGGLDESVSMLLFAATFLVAAALALGVEESTSPAVQAQS
eukprot:1796563-Amphidinium_carterae.2